MKQVEVTLYNYSELSDEAKEKALSDRNREYNDPLLQSHMINLLGEKLDWYGIETESDPDVRYSLSHSQGDGFMFIGSFSFKGNRVDIEHHDNLYYHKHTAQMTWPDFVGGEKENEEEEIAEEFITLYRTICDELEALGYDEIEYQTSSEAFEEECDANSYTFEADGEMRNA